MLQAEMEVDEEEQGKQMKEALRADSVAVLLGQALQAQDRALLERCRFLSCIQHAIASLEFLGNEGGSLGCSACMASRPCLGGMLGCSFAS